MNLRRPVLAALACAGALVAALLVAPPASAAVTDADLAYRWAPIHYQDTAAADADADYLSTVDYDGDWYTRNNWEHQDDDVTRLVGAAYYSVVETSTHWYLVYAFYHPRDWAELDPFLLDSHENDMEGLLLTVRKDGTQYGSLQSMVTVAHSDFFSFVPAGSPFTAGRETIDGSVIMQTFDGAAHPTSFQEAKGHGCKAWNGSSFPGGDGVVYYPDRTGGEVPSGGNDRSVAYRLVDAFATGGLWAHRFDSQTFASWGTFAGDNGKDNAANSAWGWDDGDDGGDLPRGMLATDPAYLVSKYFASLGTFSLSYTRNTYRG
jgi:hypothetical protein